MKLEFKKRMTFKVVHPTSLYIVVSIFIIIDNVHLVVGLLLVGQIDILEWIFPFFIYFKTVVPQKLYHIKYVTPCKIFSACFLDVRCVFLCIVK